MYLPRAAAIRKRLFGDATEKPCFYCATPLTRETATLDHKKPRSKGGSYSKTKNCVLACKDCNQRKRDMSAERFMELRRIDLGQYPWSDFTPLSAGAPKPVYLSAVAVYNPSHHEDEGRQGTQAETASQSVRRPRESEEGGSSQEEQA